MSRATARRSLACASSPSHALCVTLRRASPGLIHRRQIQRRRLWSSQSRWHLLAELDRTLFASQHVSPGLGVPPGRARRVRNCWDRAQTVENITRRSWAEPLKIVEANWLEYQSRLLSHYHL